MYAIGAGVLVALVTVLGIKLAKNEHNFWSYPLVLASYPMFYFGFAIYAGDNQALVSELMFSIPIYLIVVVCSLSNLRFSGFILSVGYILHGIYDFYHHLFFINQGSPVWWPEFCGTIDILIGVYLLVLSVKLPKYSIVQKVSA